MTIDTGRRERDEKTPDVMLLVAQNDEASAADICVRLERSGISCWMASRDVLGGANRPSQISQTLRKVRAAVLVFSEHANADNHVRREVTLAHNRNIPLIPVRIDNARPASDLSFFVGSPDRHRWIELSNPPAESEINALVAAVKSYMGVAADEVPLKSVPLQSRLGQAPATGIVGRSAELGQLTDAYKRFSEGGSVEVVLVSGEAGVGKTTLTAEMARTAFSGGACVLFGHCEEDLGFPYQPFAEALGHLVANAPEEFVRDHVEKYGPEIARVVPGIARRLAELPESKSSDPDTERYLLFASVVGMFHDAAALQPVMIVLDDLQWADRASLQLLRHVAQSAEPARLFVMGTYRDSELSSSHPLLETLGALRREPGVTRIELKGFDDDGVLAFMEAAAGEHLDEDGVGLAQAVYRETDGNPFFVGEILRHLVDSGAIGRTQDGRWVAGDDLGQISLPESVREVVGARASRLGQATKSVLSVASVIGRDFDLELLSRVSESPKNELMDVLDAAVHADLVREVTDSPGRYTFTHALIQHTLYEDLGATRRAQTHRDVGEALEELLGDEPGSRVADLAHHWFSAFRPVDLTKATEYSRLAAEAALQALAPDDALRYYRQALDLHRQQASPDELHTVDLLIGLGNAQRQSGDPAFRQTLLEAAGRAKGLGATDRLVEAALANNRGLFSALGQVDTERARVLSDAIEAMSDSDSNERALLLATLCNEYTYGKTLEERRNLAREAKSMARRLGDPSTIVRVICLVEQPIEVPSTLEERNGDTEEALDLAHELDDPVLLYFVNVYRRITSMQGADFRTSASCLEQMRELDARIAQPILKWITTFHRAAEALVEGDHEEAERLALEALQIGIDSGQPDAAAFYGTQMLIVRHLQGRMGELVSTIQDVAAASPGVPHYMGAVAACHLAAGEDAEALALLESAASDRFASLSVGFGWLEGLCAYSEVAVELGAVGPSGYLFDLLSPYDTQVGFNGLLPFEPVAMFLGSLATVLGRFEQAESLFTKATEINGRRIRPFAQARTDLAWGRMLLARGSDEEGARTLLEKARLSSVEHGYSLVHSRAEKELARLP
jgi:tetratricopeptide (TPR) repeat protein